MVFLRRLFAQSEFQLAWVRSRRGAEIQYEEAESCREDKHTCAKDIAPDTDPLQIDLRHDPFPLLVHDGSIRRDVQRSFFGGHVGEVERLFVHEGRDGAGRGRGGGGGEGKEGGGGFGEVEVADGCSDGRVEARQVWGLRTFRNTDG